MMVSGFWKRLCPWGLIGSCLVTSACSSGTQTPELSALPIREVDWQFCGEADCYEGTGIVWVAPTIDTPPAEYVEPQAYLMPEFSGHTIAIESYGCFPEYAAPQELALYDLTAPIPTQPDPNADNMLGRMDKTPVEVLDVRPLSEERVQEFDAESAVPVIAMTNGTCEPENE